MSVHDKFVSVSDLDSSTVWQRAARTVKSPFGNPLRQAVTLAMVEAYFRWSKALVPAPSRRTLIGWCEDGTFETAPRPTNGPYRVYLDSLECFVRNLCDPSSKAVRRQLRRQLPKAA